MHPTRLTRIPTPTHMCGQRRDQTSDPHQRRRRVGAAQLRRARHNHNGAPNVGVGASCTAEPEAESRAAAAVAAAVAAAAAAAVGAVGDACGGVPGGTAARSASTHAARLLSSAHCNAVSPNVSRASRSTTRDLATARTKSTPPVAASRRRRASSTRLARSLLHTAPAPSSATVHAA